MESAECRPRFNSLSKFSFLPFLASTGLATTVNTHNTKNSRKKCEVSLAPIPTWIVILINPKTQGFNYLSTSLDHALQTFIDYL